MPKNPCVRTLVGSQHFKGSKTVLKYAQQYFFQIFWWIWKKIGSKNSVLVASEIFRLFANIWTPNDKYSVSVKARVWRHQCICNYLEIEKYFLNFFLNFWNLHKIFNTLKERWASEVIWFWNYKLKKAGLLKWLKSPVSEHLWGVNMLKGTKHCLNQHDSIFVVFLISMKKKSARKILS